MSKIDKLSILGVRSFDNTRSETIQFHSPLTLIVGYNGSGKTTIIECLKYATTGDLPPNSKGGAFIHDPKLCGEKEVLAQVKLAFKSTSGIRMVATRSLQLTVKKTTRQQKTLEGQLLMLKDGERTAISSRVAELDQIMPQYLGVSKAILDSVIFCHQDESLWPLSEPSVLKKKFDEIFEALKYTKAIDNIKVLRKKQNEELGKYKLDEKYCKENKDKADRAQKKSQELSDEIEQLREETKRLGEEIKHATEEADKAWNHAAEFEKIVGTLNGRRIEAQAKQESINDLRQHMEVLDDDDQTLKQNLEQREERMKVLDDHIKGQETQYRELKASIEEVRQKVGAKQTEAGKYEAEKTHHEQQVARRETMIKEAARRHNIRGFDGELDEMQINDFMQRIEKYSRDQNVKLEHTRRETQEELQKAQKDLNKLGERRSALTQSKDFARNQISANDKKIEEFQNDINKIQIDEGGKAALESTLQDVETKLSRAKKEYEETAWDFQIREKNRELREAEDQIEQLNAELIQGTRQASDRARLDYLQKQLKDSRQSLETMQGAHGDKISRLVGDGWTPSSLEKDFQSLMTQKHAEVTDAQRQRDGVNRELEQTEFRLNTQREELKRKTGDMQQSERRVREAINDDPVSDYSDVVAKLEEEQDVLRHDRDGFANMKDWYQNCIKTAEDHNVCRLCKRGFDIASQRSEFISKLQSMISKTAMDAVTEELDAVESDLKKARDAFGSYESWRTLSKSILPDLEAEIRRLNDRREVLIGQLEEHDKVVSEREGARRDAEGFSKTISNIIKYGSDIASFENQIHELTATQGDLVGRSLEEIQEELQTVNEHARSFKTTLTKLTTDKERGKGRVNTFELELRDAKTRLTNATYELEKRESLLARVEEVRKMSQQQRETIENVEREIRDLAPQVSKAQAKYDDISQRGAEKEKELQQIASKLSDTVYHLKLADQDINSYIEKGGPTQLARCQRELKSLEQEIGRLESEQRQITIEINRFAQQLKEHDKYQRSISDNLRYRRDLRALQTINDEIGRLEARNAEIDRQRFTQEAEKWGLRHSRLSAEQSSKMGAMKSKDDQLMQLLNEWNTDYKDAAYKYKEAHIKVETTKAAIEDLGRYGGALDKAIMKYHSLKMEEINRIVEELWKRTYQGTDVDTILIRSDNENAKGNRSYNYRVCMVKQDAEMDMRGRCSAGQKVLASIIIRLALAECFGVNCGLIALDEPTTNLDRDNIRSLAESLHDIIRARQQQSNLQLIVITHDEDFLRYMKCADFCDVYYRVSRNDRQKSIIERQSIAEVT